MLRCTVRWHCHLLLGMELLLVVDAIWGWVMMMTMLESRA